MEVNKNVDLKIYASNKLVVFSKPKVATRFLMGLFYGNKPNTPEQPFKLNHDLGLESSSSVIGHVSAKFKPIDYSDIFDIKKNKKNIVLIYRKPYKRVMTGLVQCIIFDVLDNHLDKMLPLMFDNPLEFNTPLDKLFQYTTQKLFYNHKWSNISSLMDDELLKTVDADVDSLISQMLNRMITYISFLGVPNDVHLENYLSIYNSILSSNLVDKSKITLINIDDKSNNLGDILSSYDYDLFPNLEYATDNTKSNKKVVELLLNHPSLKHNFFNMQIEKHIETDNYFYNLFEKSELNILNKSK